MKTILNFENKDQSQHNNTFWVLWLTFTTTYYLEMTYAISD
jgi:hypothetical protein